MIVASVKPLTSVKLLKKTKETNPRNLWNSRNPRNLWKTPKPVKTLNCFLMGRLRKPYWLASVCICIPANCKNKIAKSKYCITSFHFELSWMAIMWRIGELMNRLKSSNIVPCLFTMLNAHHSFSSLAIVNSIWDVFRRALQMNTT